MFTREKYLEKLIAKRENHLIKVVTGIRRVGKTFLLHNLYAEYLEKDGVKADHIIKFSFDSYEDVSLLNSYFPEEATWIKVGNEERVNPRKFVAFIQERTKGAGIFYLLLDEIQILDRFVSVLNGLLRHDHFDIYVTGSNSRFLSSEIDTEFGGRGDRIHLLPLTFGEYSSGSGLPQQEAFRQYLRFGGIPLVQNKTSFEEKSQTALSIAKEVYLRDIKTRHPNVSIRYLEETLRAIASMISAPINPTRIAKTFEGKYGIQIANEAIDRYLHWFEESYLLSKALRYNIRGRRYIGTPFKVYFEDVGIRNAFLNFREIDETDLIENIVYNELRYRGFLVDVGEVLIKKKTGRLDKNGRQIYADCATEVDFVANRGGKTYYLQVALRIDTPEKKEQEYESIRNIPDSFKKIVVVKEEGLPYYTEEGFLRLSLLDFLSDPSSLEI